MKLLSALLIMMFMSGSAYADLIVVPRARLQNCFNLCEKLKERLVGVDDEKQKNKLMQDYNECRDSYTNASFKSWCYSIGNGPCGYECTARCSICGKRGDSYFERRRRYLRKLSKEEYEECLKEAEKCQKEVQQQCDICVENKKEEGDWEWRMYLKDYLSQKEEPKEITTLPEQTPNNTDTK